jgi:glycosyltransferase involved in cell wall biosynthesis
MPQIIIIEDSSIYDLGGGQRITLEAIQCLQTNKENKLHLFDVGAGDKFREQVSCHKIYSKFFGIRSIPGFIYKLPIIIFEILKKTDVKKKLFLYPTTKKALIVAVLIKFIYRHGVLVFHQHSRLGSLFKVLKIFAHTIIIPGLIAEKYSKKTVVIQNPINITKSKFQSNHDEGNIIVGFIGSLTPHKGFDLFVEALGSNKMDALVAGSGPLENIMIKHDNLKYLGYINGDDKHEFYKKIDILVLPSIVEETFSLVCFEALFNYIPVVCFDKGYPSKIIGKYNTGVVANEQNVSSLNFAVKECIDNIAVLSENCSAVINDFDNADFCKNLLKVFSS